MKTLAATLALTVAAEVGWPAGGLRGAVAVFPTVVGTNLEKEEFTLPRGFRGDVNLVFLAYRQRQQAEVDTWIPLARDLHAVVPGLEFYELPTLSTNWGWLSGWIDGGMRDGIADPFIRARTITLYLEKGPFRESLLIPDERKIDVLLIRPTGEILWRVRGPATAAAVEDLRRVVATALR